MHLLRSNTFVELLTDPNRLPVDNKLSWLTELRILQSQVK